MTYDIPVLSNQKPVINIVIKAEEPKPKEPRLYTIKEGDTLTSISKDNNVPLERIWAANPELADPDRIEPSQSLRIPENEEVLPERAMPSTIQNGTVNAGSTAFGVRNSPPRGGFSSTFDIAPAGWYPVGQCTQFVWSKRPVGKWGNASSWVSNAQRDGVATGNIPRVGAVGQQGNHVVYIEAVDGNRVYLSERNYDWNGSYRERWANAYDFTYIY